MTKPGERSVEQEAIETNGETQGMDHPLHEVFLEEIADIYNAEQQIVKTLPRMMKAAQSEELREALQTHLSETEQQVVRIEEAMESLGEKLKRKKCKGMEGLLAEGAEMMQENKGESSIDAVIIASAQKVEHYEMASYGTICAWAKQMGHQEALTRFQETLNEEKAADEKLTEVAESIANVKAQERT